MTGYILPCIPKRTISFGVFDTDHEFVLADKFELIHWREVTMVVRVHSHTLAGTTNTISVGVYPQSTSIDDPGLTFIDAGSFGGVTISQTTPVPALLTLPFQDYAQPYHPPMMRVVAKSTRTTTGTISGTVSIDISVKDS